MTDVLPDYDEDRVYDSDIRKVYQWYNILIDKGLINKEAVETEAAQAQEEE